MVGRGELGFVVAKMAVAMGLLHEEAFSACIWALLLATIIGPFMFQYFLTFDPDRKELDNNNGHTPTEISIKKVAPMTVLTEKEHLFQPKATYGEEHPQVVRQDSDI
jgi:hypothetical protein